MVAATSRLRPVMAILAVLTLFLALMPFNNNPLNYLGITGLTTAIFSENLSAAANYSDGANLTGEQNPIQAGDKNASTGANETESIPPPENTSFYNESATGFYNETVLPSNETAALNASVGGIGTQNPEASPAPPTELMPPNGAGQTETMPSANLTDAAPEILNASLSSNLTEAGQTGLNLSLSLRGNETVQEALANESAPAKETKKEHAPTVRLKNRNSRHSFTPTGGLEIELEPDTEGAFLMSITEEPKAFAHISGLKSNLSAKLDRPKETRVKTAIFSVEENAPIDSAILSLPKYGDVGAVLYCPSYDQTSSNCPFWVTTQIPFTQNSTHITFTVTHFTAYAGGAPTYSSNLTIWDDTDTEGGSKLIAPGGQVYFYANYTNSTSGAGINGTGVYCNVTFSDSNATMSWNTSSLLYYYNRSFPAAGTYAWNSTCDGSALGYDALNASDTVAINDSITSCGQLSTPNAIYTLAGNVNSSGTCFTILANNITFDGQGFTVNYSQGGVGYGVVNLGGYDNITLKNLKLVQGNSSNQYAYAVYASGMSNSSIQGNTITTFGWYGYGIYLYSSSSNTLSNNNITTLAPSGYSGYGIYLSQSSDSNAISNNNITTPSGPGIVISFSQHSNLSGNIISSPNSDAISISAAYNHTIDTTNTESGKPIYYYFAQSSTTIENLYDIGQLIVANATNVTIRNVTLINNDGISLALVANSSITDSNVTTTGAYEIGIKLDSSQSNTIANNTIKTAGYQSSAIQLSSSTSNTIANNNITATGTTGYGAYLRSSSSFNVLLNNNVKTTDNSIAIESSSGGNRVTGGSLISTANPDYRLSDAGATNNFTNTNFTASRKIYFADNASWFNYNNETNGNIWLKTNVSAASTLTRTLVTWSQSQMKWNDTNSTSGITARYNLTGLFASTQYNVTSTTSAGSTSQILTTDASGVLPSFTIDLNGNTEIKVMDDILPSLSFADPTPSDGVTVANNWTYINTTLSEASQVSAFIDWNRSLVGWWRFNQEAGENNTFFRDWSSWGNNGTNGSNPVYATGKFGKAIEFDGVDDYINTTNFADNLPNFSVSVWFKSSSSSSSYAPLVTKMTTDVTHGIGWGLYFTGYGTSAGMHAIIQTDSGNWVSKRGSTQYNDSSWHHAVMVVRNGNTVNLYMDSALYGSDYNGGTIGSYSNTQTVKIGTDVSPYYFNGSIDEVRIFNRALSPEEINASYNAGAYRLYHNFTSLADGAYTYAAYAQDLAGNVNQTETRSVRIDANPPYDVSSCQSLSIAGGYYQLVSNVSSSGTCFTIGADNITLDGQGYWVNYSQSVLGYGVNNSGGYDNITIKNLNIVQGNSTPTYAYAIYGSGMSNSTIFNNTITSSANTNYGIFLAAGSGSGSNNISNNILTFSGGDIKGIYLQGSNNNYLSNNTVSSNLFAIFIQSSSNVLSNNIVSGSYAYYINGGSNNNVTGGSTSSAQYHYALQSAGTTNKFTNTNFTAQIKIRFEDATSWFNYNNETNGNVWLKTSVSAASTLTRTLGIWSQAQMRWNDTNSTGGIVATYNLTGLFANTIYNVYNTSGGVQTNSYTLATDVFGRLPSFTIGLNGNTEIKVIDDILPSLSFADPTPSDAITVTNNWTYINTTLSEASQVSAFIDWNRSLVGWWRFNNETGENNTFFRDWSSWGNNGTNGSNPVYTTGKFGKGLQFDGSDDYVDAGNGASLQITNAITIEAWFFYSASGGVQQYIVGKGRDSNSGYHLFAGSNNYLYGRVNGVSGSSYVNVNVLTPNTWSHGVFTYDKNAGGRLYLNGNSVGTSLAEGNITYITDNTNVAIGKHLGHPSFPYYFSGTIDEVKIWNRALSPEEINASYNAGAYRLYHNFTNLADGAYTYTAYAQDLAGNVNQTETRSVRIDANPPYDVSSCQSLSIAGGYYQLVSNVSSLGTCFNVLADNITLDGQGYWINYSQSQSGYAVNNSGAYDYLTIKNLNVVQGSSITYAYAIYTTPETHNLTVENNTIRTYGNFANGIYFDDPGAASTNFRILNNTFTTSYATALEPRSAANGTVLGNLITSGYHGILTTAANTLFQDNRVTTGSSGCAFYCYYCAGNNITGGSFSSADTTYCMDLNAGANNFRNTNFTVARKIFFYDNTSQFPYNNETSGGVWLNTKVSKTATLTRTLVVWSQREMRWNDTNSTGGVTANYTLTGLFAGTNYSVYNTSGGVQTNSYVLTTDASGNLPGFTIGLNGATEVKVNASMPYGLGSCQDLTIPGGSYVLTANVSSQGTCFNILADNIMLDGAGFTVNYSQFSSGNSVYASGRNNLTIKSLNIAQGNSSVSSAEAIYFYSVVNSSIFNNTIITNGASSRGIRLENQAKRNNITNNVITTASTATPIWLYLSSDSNTISNNILKANIGESINIRASYNNSILGGSIISASSSDYYFEGADETNKFTNTNFTASRKIRFIYATDWFNYNNETNGNIWLKTNPSVANREITRTLLKWSQLEMRWNDTNSTGGVTANYTLTGLFAGTNYSVYNASGGVQSNSYVLTTDASGSLPGFTIGLNGATEVTVNASMPYGLGSCQDLTIPGGSYVLTANVSSAGTCFTILANGITLDGQGYAVNYSQISTGYAINNSGGYDNITIKNLKLMQGNWSVLNSRAIYAEGMDNGTILNNTITLNASGGADSDFGIYLRAANSNKISNNSIATSGDSGYAIYFSTGGGSNEISNNIITTAGTNAYGIYLYFNHYNTVQNNTVTTTGTSAQALYLFISHSNRIENNAFSYLAGAGGNPYAVWLSSASSNNITGSSITSSLTDYNLQNASNTNNFANTNFTSARKIRFADNSSWFNYNNETNGNIWLKTAVSNATTITRTLVKWSQSEMRWNDTNSTGGITANYTITGLTPNTTYSVYNTTGGAQTKAYALATDSSGDLPSFTINLTGNTEIKAIDDTPPTILFSSPTDADNSYLPRNYTYINASLSDGYNSTLFVDLNRSLVGWWRFNQEAGENNTFFRDWSSWGNNGTNGSNPVYTTGKFGKGLWFDGSDDYVDAGNGASLNFTSGTISFWIQPNTNVTVSKDIISKYSAVGTGGWSITQYIGDDIDVFVYNSSYAVNAPNVLPLTWTHISVILNNNETGKTYIQIYKNDIKVADSFVNTNIVYTAYTLQFNGGGRYGAYFNGTIDEVRIFNRILAPEEINASYNAGAYRLYRNFAGLADGAYSYTAYAQDLAGNVNQTETRTLTVDTALPAVGFVAPTDSDGSYIPRNWSFVNVSVSDAYNTTAFINWNNSLVGWWRFNEGSGTTAQDFSGWGNNGTLKNGSTTCAGGDCPTWTAGKFGKGLQFDGVDDNIYAGNGGSLNANTSLTFEAWAKFNNDTRRQMLAYKFNNGPYRGFYIDMNPNPGGNWATRLSLGFEGSVVSPILWMPLSTNTWYHLAYVFNGSRMIYYVNGSEKLTYDIGNVTSISPTSNPMYIASADSTSFVLNGSIDEVKLWNRALSPEEITASYNAGAFRLQTTFTGLNNGAAYTYKAYAQDLAGNVNETESRTLTIDLTPPYWWGNLTSPVSLATAYSQVQFNVSAADLISPVDTVLLEFNSSNYTTTKAGNVYTRSISGFPPGVYTYRWYLNDSAGNVNVTTALSYSMRNLSFDWLNLSDAHGQGDNILNLNERYNITVRIQEYDGTSYYPVTSGSFNLTAGGVTYPLTYTSNSVWMASANLNAPASLGNYSFLANVTGISGNGINGTAGSLNYTYSVKNISIGINLDDFILNQDENVTVSGRAVRMPEWANVANNSIYLYLDGQYLKHCGSGIVSASCKWFYDGWAYRSPVNISSPSTLPDYQLRLDINWTSGMKTNFDDLRFTYNGTSGEIPLPHWVESYTADANATIWIKTNLTTGNNRIYLYYGNPLAAGTSNGSATFEFFDDFEGTALDGDKWGIGGGGGSASVSGGILTLTGGPPDGTKYVYGLTNYGVNMSTRFKARMDTTYTYKWLGLEESGQYNTYTIYTDTFRTDSTGANRNANEGNNTNYLVSGLGVTHQADTYYTWEIVRTGTATKFYVDNTLRKDGTTYPSTTSRHVIINTWTTSSNIGVDWVLVRKYAFPEPSIIMTGMQENWTQTNRTGGYSYTFRVNETTTVKTWTLKVNLTDGNGIYGENTTTFTWYPTTSGSVHAPDKLIGDMGVGDYTFQLNVTVNNTGNGGMFNPAAFVDWVLTSSNIKSVVNISACAPAKVDAASSCTEVFNVTLAAGSTCNSGDCPIAWVANWSTNNQSILFAPTYTSWVVITGNPQMVLSNYSLQADSNISYPNIRYVDVNNTGNVILGDGGGTVAVSFLNVSLNGGIPMPQAWVSFYSTGTWSQPSNSWDYIGTGFSRQLRVNITPTEHYTGNYTGIINITATNDLGLQAYREINLTVSTAPAFKIEGGRTVVMSHGTSTTEYFLVNSTGNAKVVNATVSLVNESLPGGWVALGNYNGSIIEGTYLNVSLGISIPEYYAPGNYTARLNVTSNNVNGSYANLTITVLRDDDWNFLPLENQTNSFWLNNPGIVGNITIFNTGNVEQNFTITIGGIDIDGAGPAESCLSWTCYGSYDKNDSTTNFILVNPSSVFVPKGSSRTIFIWQKSSSQNHINTGITITMANSTATPTSQVAYMFTNTTNMKPALISIGTSVGGTTQNFTELNLGITLEAIASDDVLNGINVSAAYFNVTTPNGTIQQFSPSSSAIEPVSPEKDRRQFTYEYVNTQAPGKYGAIFYVKDTSANVIGSFPVHNFTVYENTTVSLSPTPVSASSITYYSGYNISVPVSVTNTGNATAYSLNLSGAIQNWLVQNVTIPNISFWQANSSGVTVSIPANTPPGAYILYLNVSWLQPGGKAASASSSTTVTVGSNQTYNVSGIADGYTFNSVLHGMSNVRAFNITALGNEPTVVTISSSGAPRNITIKFSENNVSYYTTLSNLNVANGGSKTAYLDMSVTKGESPGTSSHLFNVDLANAQASKSYTNLAANILSDDAYNLTHANISINGITNQNTLNREILVTSNANVPISFGFNLTGNVTEFMFLQNATATLQPLEIFAVGLNYTAPNNNNAYEGFLFVNDTTAPTAYFNISVTFHSYTLDLNITGLSAPAEAVAGDTISLNMTLLLGTEYLTNQTSYAVSLDGVGCPTNSVLVDGNVTGLVCTLPAHTDVVYHNLTVQANYGGISGGLSISKTRLGAVYYKDVTRPRVYNLSSQEVPFGQNVTLNVTVVDNTGVEAVFAEVTPPSGLNSTRYLMQNYSASGYFLVLSNLTELGDYLVRYYANDSIGNLNGSETVLVEVYSQVFINGTIADALGGPILMNMRFYKEGSSAIIEETTTSVNGTYNFTKLHKRRYDLYLNTTSYAISLHSVNISGSSSNLLQFDPITSPPVFPYTRSVIKMFAFEPTFTFTRADITVKYLDNVPLYENSLRFYRCGSWSYNLRSCGGSWTRLGSGTIDKVNHVFSIVVMNFSAYALGEDMTAINEEMAVCGDHLCATVFGESCVTCPGDCGYCSTSSTTTISSGSSFYSAPQQPQPQVQAKDPYLENLVRSLNASIANFLRNQSLQSQPPKPKLTAESNAISLDLYPGESTKTHIKLHNGMNDTKFLFFSASDSIENFVSFLKPPTKLEAGEEETVGVQMSIPPETKPGVYWGEITIGSYDKSVADRIPVNIRVSEMKEKLLDVKIQPLSESVLPGEALKVQVDMYNLGQSKRVDVELLLQLLNPSTEDEVVATLEAIAIETTASVIKSINVPKSTPTGRYTIKGTAYYASGNRNSVFQATSIASVNVVQSAWDRLFFGIPLWAFVSSILLVSLTLGSSIAYRRWNERRRKYLNVVDFRDLPQPSQTAGFIGKVAETDIRTFIDMQKLQMHAVVAGATGGGKTIAAQIIAEEALKAGIGIIVFDPTAQWTGFLRKCTDKRMLGLYPKFQISTKDARVFPGNVHTINDARQVIDMKRYLRPGEINVFTLNKLDPKDIDIIVASTIRQVFKANLDESPALKYLIVYEEVHRLLPKFGGSGDGFIQLERGVREFRKWGVGLLLISQVLSDFVGEIKANIGTEVQMRTRAESDLERIKLKYGEEFLTSIVKASEGVGMLENSSYNKGRPYFVEFRPILHGTTRLSDQELEKYDHYNRMLEDMSFQVEQLTGYKVDVFDTEVELKLAYENLHKGAFNMVDIYLESLEPKLKGYWSKIGKKPVKMEMKLVDLGELKQEIERVKKKRGAMTAVAAAKANPRIEALKKEYEVIKGRAELKNKGMPDPLLASLPSDMQLAEATGSREDIANITKKMDRLKKRYK